MSFFPIVASIALLSLLQQTPSPPAPRRIVVREGDTVVIPAGVDARIDRSRDGDARLVAGSDARELILLFDEARGGSTDGAVDRVFRLRLQEDFPPDLLYRGPARLEEIDPIKNGEVQRRAYPTLVTSDKRLQFVAIVEEATGAFDTYTFRTTSGESRTLNDSSWPGGRSFDDVEHAWVNHLENSRSRIRTELTGPNIRNAPPVETPPSVPAEAPLRPEDYHGRRDFTFPRTMREVRPQYTAGAMERGVQGKVLLDVTVQPDGTVSDARVTRPLDPELDRASIEAVRQWRFAPATLAGKPVPVVVSIELAFTLKK